MGESSTRKSTNRLLEWTDHSFSFTSLHDEAVFIVGCQVNSSLPPLQRRFVVCLTASERNTRHFWAFSFFIGEKRNVKKPSIIVSINAFFPYTHEVRLIFIHIELIMCFTYINLFNTCKIYSSNHYYHVCFADKDIKAQGFISKLASEPSNGHRWTSSRISILS